MSLASAVEEFPLFKGREEKERFLLALGLLASRTITLAKAAELLGMSRLEFSAVLRGIGFKYSYLDEGEVPREAGSLKAVINASVLIVLGKLGSLVSISSILAKYEKHLFHYLHKMGGLRNGKGGCLYLYRRA